MRILSPGDSGPVLQAGTRSIEREPAPAEALASLPAWTWTWTWSGCGGPPSGAPPPPAPAVAAWDWTWTWTSACDPPGDAPSPIVATPAAAVAGSSPPAAVISAVPAPAARTGRRDRSGRAHRNGPAQPRAPAARPSGLPTTWPARLGRARPPVIAVAASGAVAPSAAAHDRPRAAHESAHPARPPAPPLPAPWPAPWPGPAATAQAVGSSGSGLIFFVLAVMVAAPLLGPAAQGGRLAMTAVARLRAGSSRPERPG